MDALRNIGQGIYPLLVLMGAVAAWNLAEIDRKNTHSSTQHVTILDVEE